MGKGEFDGCQNARVTVDRFNPVVSGAKLSISSMLCGFSATTLGGHFARKFLSIDVNKGGK